MPDINQDQPCDPGIRQRMSSPSFNGRRPICCRSKSVMRRSNSVESFDNHLVSCVFRVDECAIAASCVLAAYLSRLSQFAAFMRASTSCVWWHRGFVQYFSTPLVAASFLCFQRLGTRDKAGSWGMSQNECRHHMTQQNESPGTAGAL
jgi:hypothetical protein